MKKQFILFFAICLSIGLTSCKTEHKKDEANESTSQVQKASKNEDCQYSLNREKTFVSWTAFKTTAKVPVGGRFTAYDIKSAALSSSEPSLLIQGAEFKIDVASTNTENPDRDMKIKKHFFGTLANTATITGKVKEVKGNKAILSITMNNETHDAELNYSVEEDILRVKGTIDVAKWSGNQAIDALNKICYELHKGEDGVSKLWSEVDVLFKSPLKKECK